MERLKLKLSDADKALATLEEIVKEPMSKIVRDASILRFQYSFEVFWKCVKEYLKEKEGSVCNSPKSCFRELLTAGLCDEVQVVSLQEMTDDRNETAHTYKEAIAEKIHSHINAHIELIKQTLASIKNNVN
ncbi:MAG: nucleotidyltransferase substrate binding protein (TIGR01987 family) [Candidatus Omnitrophota bacterium]|jgi:nucleotidyltransferase substrate binding protein (TIGR01987 family)